MGELFKLSETKLQELPDNRQVMLHLTHFEFKGNQHQVDKALQLTWKLLNISGLEDQKQRDFQKAFEEAVKNGIRHGHRGDKAKSLDVVFMMNNEVINVTVEDKGSGFNYQQFFEDTPQKKESGFYPMRQQHQRETRGMKILDENCDRVEYLGAGNCVRLTKFIPKAT